MCGYQPGPLAETCARTDFAADWPGAAIANDIDFCTYLGTDALGQASDVNCDSIFLPWAEDKNAPLDPVCSRNGEALGKCILTFGPLDSWNDLNYCGNIIKIENRGALTGKQACDSSSFQIKKHPLFDIGDPAPTNTNRGGLKFCTYTAAQACVPRGDDPCVGKDHETCTGALGPLCNWGP